MHHFCTYFNQVYLLRGIALYQSLKAHHHQPFVLWVLCFDDFTYTLLTKLAAPDLRPIALADFERGDTALLAAKQTRSTTEYFFTCSPSLPLYVLHENPDAESVTYLDADLFFFGDVQAVFEELGNQSILIIPHRFPPYLKSSEQHGIYNVGLLIFKNDKNGIACLQWWRERCLEWCYDRLEPGRYADQKYLDDWPTRFPGVVVSKHKGANLAPWNWMNYRIYAERGRIMIDDDPLIFYHYQGLRFLTHRIYDPNVFLYRTVMPADLLKIIYSTYIENLRVALKWIRQAMPEFAPPPSGILSRSYGVKMFIKSLLRRQIIWLPAPL